MSCPPPTPPLLQQRPLLNPCTRGEKSGKATTRQATAACREIADPEEKVRRALAYSRGATGCSVYNSKMGNRVIHISATDAARDFAALLDRVRTGDEVVIEHDARPVAVLCPVKSISCRIPIASHNPVILTEILRGKRFHDSTSRQKVLFEPRYREHMYQAKLSQQSVPWQDMYLPGHQRNNSSHGYAYNRTKPKWSGWMHDCSMFLLQ